MKILIDVNLTPAWVGFLRDKGIDAVHWTEVGDPGAPDSVVMASARDAGQIVFTHDLDFGVLLALTKATGPSVLQLRAQDTLPNAVGAIVLAALEQHGMHSTRGPSSPSTPGRLASASSRSSAADDVTGAASRSASTSRWRRASRSAASTCGG